MRFIDIVTASEQITSVTNQRIEIKRAIRAALEKYSASFDWPHYRTWSFFTTIAPYTTGTVSVTNASKTVTGSSTVWTSAMIGRKLRVGSLLAYYTINAVGSATSITLDQPYQGDTASAQTYTIYQDEYRLAGDVDKPKLRRQIQTGAALFELHYADLDIRWPTPNATGDPFFDSIIGRQPDVYETGTITIAVSGTTITGSGTSWTTVPGLSRGNRIATRGTGASTEVYTIKSVDSDTQLTVYELAVAASSAVSYTIYLDNIKLQVYRIPDAARNIYYRYSRIPLPLVNDYDEPDMPRQWHYMLAYAGASWAFASKSNPTMAQYYEALFNKWIEDQKNAIGHLTQDQIFLKKDMDLSITTPSYSNYPGAYGLPLGFP